MPRVNEILVLFPLATERIFLPLQLVSLDSSNKGPPLGKRTRKATTRRNLDADSSKRKRKRARASMIKRETPCLPDVGALARLPLVTTRAPLHPERYCSS